MSKHTQHRNIDELADTEISDSSRPALAATVLSGDARSGPIGGRDPVDTPGLASSGAELRAIERDKRYRVLGEHARGGLGRVLKARDERLGREVAIKELLKATSFAEALFLREALITARLQHPGIVPVHEAGRWDSGDPYYIMKLVSGKSLQELIRDQKSLRERMGLLSHVIDVVETIAYAHSQGVIHRDIKPANILVGDFGETVVVDWGLARDDKHPVLSVQSLAQAALEPEQGSDAASGTMWRVSGNYSVSGKVVGTPAYMSPEQARGEEVDERSDVYALGALLYELLSGDRPYLGNNLQEVLEQALAGPPRPLAECLADSDDRVPSDLLAIVDKAMARERDERYPTARELAADLNRFQAGQMVSAHDYSPWALVRRWLWRHRAIVAVAALALAVVAMVGAVSMKRVIKERNIAELQRSKAQAAQLAAEASRNDLLLLQASDSLSRDPTATVAWLKKAPLAGAYFARARQLYEDAVSRGVSRHVFSFPANVKQVLYLPGGKQVVAMSEDGTLQWHDLNQGTSRVIVTGDTLNRMSLSPDGTRIAVGTTDGEIRLIELGQDGNADHTRVLRGHEGTIQGLEFSADGARLASAGSNSGRVWDVASGKEIAHVEISGTTAAITSDLGRVALGGADGSVRVLDASTGDELARVVLSAPVLKLRFSPDNRHLAAYTVNKKMHLIDTRSKTTRELGEASIYVATRSLAFSPKGRWLAYQGKNWSVVLWDLAGNEHRYLHGHENNVFALAFSQDERWLASASDDCTVRLWDVLSEHVRVLRGHTDDVGQVAFSPAGDTLASGSMDKSLRIWPVQVDGTVSLSGHKKPLGAVSFSGPDELTTAAVSGEIFRWNVSSWSRRLIAEMQSQPMLWNQSLSPDGRLAVALNNRTRSIEIRDLGANTHEVLDNVGNSMRKLAFAPDSAGFAVIERNTRKAVIWQRHTKKRIEIARDRLLCSAALAPGARYVALMSPSRAEVVDLESASTVADFEILHGNDRCSNSPFSVGMQYSDDGIWLVVPQMRRGMVLWNSRDQRVQRFDLGRYVANATAFSSDNTQLAVACGDRSIHLLDIARGAHRKLGYHEDAVWKLAFSPDGKTLASASYDQTVRLWNVATGTVRVLRGHSDSVSDVAFSSDGTQLASASEDGTLRLWDVSRDFIPDSGALRALLDAATTAVIDPDAHAMTQSGDSS